MRKTKIIATLGPATDAPGALEAAVGRGIDVVRLNFSHASHAEHLARCDAAREIAAKIGCPLAVLADLQGPKIRIGELASGPILLKDGESFIITTEDVAGDRDRVSTNYKRLNEEVGEGETILLDDGKIRLRVETVAGAEVRTRVEHGGVLQSRKAINLPGTTINAPALTDKDLDDLRFALEELQVEYVALSFVRSPDDIRALKNEIERLGGDVGVIAKIEKPEAVARIDDVIAALELGDGLMVARGDLGVECEIRRVPALQKKILRKADEAGVICITATQMLESMITSPMPTRAESSDVFNAILDGTDAAMLSGETAVGLHPAKAVAAMSEIIREAERYNDTVSGDRARIAYSDETFELAICKAAATAAVDAGAQAIVALTRSGRTALLMSKVEIPSHIPFFAVTADRRTHSRMALYYGVRPLLIDNESEITSELWGAVDAALLATGELEQGDTVVVASGYQIGRGATNVCKIVSLGEHDQY